jgi:hypothetical protein
MLKILRKYNKWILVIGGSLLMIAWLMPQGLQRMGSSSKGAKVGTLDGSKIYERDLIQFEHEIRAVGTLIPTVLNNLLGESPDPASHWMLLAHEADEAGLIGGPQDGANWLQDIAPELAYQALRAQYEQFDEAMFRRFILPNQQQMLMDQTQRLREAFAGVGIEMAARESNLTPDQVHTAVAKARGIFRLTSAYMSAPRASQPTALIKARTWGERATAEVAFIPADLLTATIADPSEEDLVAHYEQYRDALPGSGEFGIGYRQPPGIRLEWLKLDRPALREVIPVDPVAAYKEWQLNRTTYPGEFAAEKMRVEDAIRDRRAGEVIQSAITVVRAEMFKSLKKLEKDGDYWRLPADWSTSRPRLEAIAQTVQAQVSDSAGIAMPLPSVTVRADKWQNAGDLAAEPDLARAQVRYAARRYPLTQPAGQGQAPLVFQVRELGFQTPLFLQTGIPISDYPAEDDQGSIYFYTVLDARQESPPDSIDEVRELVIADLKRLRAYEALAARTDEFRLAATAGGVSAVSDLFRPAPSESEMPPEPVALPTVIQSVVISRTSVSGVEQVNTEAFRDAVMAAAGRIDPLSDPATYDAANATVAIPIPGRLGVGVAKIKRVTPVTWEVYRQGIEGTLAQDAQQEVARATTDWPFSLEAAAARHGWKLPEREDGATPAPETEGQTEQG